MRTALELLEQIQYQFVGLIPSEEVNENAMQKILDQMQRALGIDLDFLKLKNYYNDMADIPTKYQSRPTYALLRRLVEKIEKVTREHSEMLKKRYKIELVDFPVYGTIPMGDFSAQVIGCGMDNETLMLFCDGFFGMANLVSKAVSQSFPMTGKDDRKLSFSTDKEKVKEYIRNDKIAMARFMDVVLAYAFKQNPHYAKQYMIDREHIQLVEIIRDALEKFVVAHEYAHLCLGHLSKENTKRKTDILNNYDRVIYSWTEEMSADLLATQITVLSSEDPALGMAGIWICFNIIDILDALNGNDNDDRSILQQYSTHPPAEMRKENIKNAMENKGCLSLLNTIDYIFTEVIKYSDRLLRVLRTFADERGLEIRNIDFEIIQKIIYSLV